MKSSSGPLADAFAQAWAGIGVTSESSSSKNHPGLTAFFMVNTTVLALGVVTLATSSGIPTPGLYGPQLAGSSLMAALISSKKKSTSLEVIGWPSDHL